MKTINRITAIVLSAALLLPSVLLWSNLSFLKTSAYSALTAVTSIRRQLNGNLKDATVKIEQAVSDYVGFHHSFVNLFGLGMRLIGSRLVNTGDRTIVKLDSGAVCGYETDKDKVNEQAKTVKKNAALLAQLKAKLTQQNIPLLFVLAPNDLDRDHPGLPYRLHDYNNEIADSYLNELDRFGIDYIDLRRVWKEQGWSIADGFFYSDTHWRPKYALLSWGYVAQYLNDHYDIQNDPALFDLKNQRVETYPNVSLGNTGRVIGKYYAKTDTTELYLPNYETEFHVVNKRLGWDKTGSYEETTVDRTAVNRGGLFTNDLIDLYSARDSMVENKNAANDANVVFIRDSFGGMLGGYVPLTFHNTSLVDPRAIDAREEESVSEIIDNFDTDLVIVFYFVSMLPQSQMFAFN